MSSFTLAPKDKDPLDGWKNIAAFFKRGVRTVQMWERLHRLPVHRLQGRVLAYPTELEAWRREHQTGPRDSQSG